MVGKIQNSPSFGALVIEQQFAREAARTIDEICTTAAKKNELMDTFERIDEESNKVGVNMTLKGCSRESAKGGVATIMIRRTMGEYKYPTGNNTAIMIKEGDKRKKVPFNLYTLGDDVLTKTPPTEIKNPSHKVIQDTVSKFMETQKSKYPDEYPEEFYEIPLSHARYKRAFELMG